MHRHHHFFGGRDEHRGRGPWGGMRGMRHGHEHHGHHRGGRVGRFLEHGDLRFVVLALIAEQPRHGYELIKELEDRTGGAYRPSPGVIYPLLAMLEDEGFIRPAQAEGGRKLFEITPEGQTALEQNRAGVDAVFSRMAEASEGSRMGGHRVGRAMANLGMALGQRMRREISEEQIDKIISMIDDTAAAIEKV
ncbi:PadR family transcriptional regulator [Phenylobacterium sp.]|uniref:PadR family transcriptional regulator n=1 Tax=Phenylobacterium sp. TaxID=1871053 RepID=UPI001220BA28|nr:PadR family transcriptional regulator [Phenylobacterium sp.]THD57719.1 MAG: PadR family transcriptional regulator [Phenylobacterium sp.]